MRMPHRLLRRFTGVAGSFNIWAYRVATARFASVRKPA